jgi:DNA topoisomerase-1
MKKPVYVDDDLPGITRRRAGRGWAYYDTSGALITDRGERRRLNAIALPLAYADAWFCPAPNGHILATGYDDAGRKQYRYHPDFCSQQDSAKYDACAAFGKRLPLIRKRVEAELSGRDVPRERALAAVVRLLDLSAIRIGNEHYARANESYGATTLRADHADVGPRRLELHFVGKGGKEHDLEFEDADLAAAVRRMEDLDHTGAEDPHLFRFKDEDGTVRPVTSADVNAYLRETMGEDFSAKHFRTFHASSLAFEKLVEGPGEVRLKAMLEHVADRLGNTPAIVRSAYIHPAVIARTHEQEAWRAGLKLPRKTRWLSRAERGLIAFLEECGSAGDYLAGEQS